MLRHVYGCKVNGRFGRISPSLFRVKHGKIGAAQFYRNFGTIAFSCPCAKTADLTNLLACNEIQSACAIWYSYSVMNAVYTSAGRTSLNKWSVSNLLYRVYRCCDERLGSVSNYRGPAVRKGGCGPDYFAYVFLSFSVASLFIDCAY